MRSISVTVGVVLAVALGIPAASSTAVTGPAPGSARTAPGVQGTARATAIHEHPLFAVSCVSPRYCVAVGSDEAADNGHGGPLVQTWNGKTWAAAVVKLPAGTLGGALFGVSCKSQKSCIAVGDYFLQNDNFPENDNTGTLAESWNGKTWTLARPPVPAGTTSAALSDVSCVTPAYCIATGAYTRTDGTTVALAERWTGKVWVDVPVKLPAGSLGGALFGVSCASAKSCIAVGSYGNAEVEIVALGESWNGKTWTASQPPAPAGAFAAALQGVSCVSPTVCIAAGSYTNAAGFPFALAESWNGKRWTLTPLPKSGGSGGMFAVSCASLKYCLAVGNGGAPGASRGTPASYVWNGKSWSFKKVPVPPTGGGDTANSMLQGDQCLSPTYCAAVGQLDLGSDEQFQYGFSGFWNGKTWKPTPTA